MPTLANPFSTGAGGTSFEIKVQASFVVAMLCGGSVPGLPETSIKKIKLQGKFLGFATDDLVVYAEDLSGIERKLLAQIKHQISFTKGDKVLAEVLSAAWSDFSDSEKFNNTKDSLALITGPLSKADSNSIRTILDWARHSETADDFLLRVQAKYYSSDDKREKLKAVRHHLENAQGTGLSDQDLWRFCKAWNVFGYDLDSESSVTKSQILALIQSTKTDVTDSADGIWAKVVGHTSAINQNAGMITADKLSPDLKSLFSTAKRNDDIARLREHGHLILKRIDDQIGGFHLARNDIKSDLAQKLNESDFVLVSGSAGNGKSALALNAINDLNNGYVFYFRTEDFNFPHLDSAFASMGLKSRLTVLAEKFALIPRKVLVIESIEKLLELDHTEALLDLLNLLGQDPTWKIVATCRAYSIPQLTAFCFSPAKIYPAHVEVHGLTDEELNDVKRNVPQLAKLLDNPKTIEFLRNPFFLSIAFKVAGRITCQISEASIKEAIWNDVIGKSSDRKNGLPLRRTKAFVEVSVRRARQMLLAVNVDNVDADAILKLEQDGLITSFNDHTYAASHDLLEDWAIERFISNAFVEHEADPDLFFNSIGSGLAFRRTFRHWFQTAMKDRETNLRPFVLNALSSNAAAHWKDEVITCVLMSEAADRYLSDLTTLLFVDDLNLLKRFAFILRTTCKEPDKAMMKLLGIKSASGWHDAKFLKPAGNGWAALVTVIYNNRSRLDRKFVGYVAPLLKDWFSLVNVQSEITPEMATGGQVALHFLSYLKDAYQDDHISDLTEVIIKAYPGIQLEVDAILEAELFHTAKRRPPYYIEVLSEQALTTFNCAYLCKTNPKLLIRIAWANWKEDEEPDEYHRSLDIPGYFGLKEPHTKTNFNNCSALKGPFWGLLQWNAVLGIDFILDLANYAAEKYANSSLSRDEKFGIDLNFSDMTVTQICSSRIWKAYTGTSVNAGVVTCALMALEKWLISKAELGESIESISEHILKRSKSVYTTAVIAGLAPKYWDKIGKPALDLLKCREFFSLDIERMVCCRSSGALDFFGMEFHDPMADIHRIDRKKANDYEWRKSHLEDVARQFLLSPMREEMGKIIDDHYRDLPPMENQTAEDRVWRIALSRMDLRKYTITEDKENKVVIFNAPVPPADIKQVQDESHKQLQYNNRFMTLNLWGTQKYQRELTEDKYYPNWNDALEEAKWAFAEMRKKPGDDMMSLFAGGLIYTAAYCVREHISEIHGADLNWIVSLFIDLVEKDSEAWLDVHLGDAGRDGLQAAASRLSQLLTLDCLSAKQKLRLKEAVVISLIHPNSSIRVGAAQGIREYIWEYDADFANLCLAGSVAASRLHKSLSLEQRYSGKPKDVRKQLEKTRTAFAKIRNQILSGKAIFTLQGFSFETYSTWDLKAAVSLIPARHPSENSISLLTAIFLQLFKLETEKNQDRSNLVDYKFQFLFETKVGNILLEQGLPFCEKHFHAYVKELIQAPQLVANLIKKIVLVDREHFLRGNVWPLWSYFANFALNGLVAESSRTWDAIRWSKLSEIPRALLFAGVNWKRENFELEILESGKSDILAFFRGAGSHPEVFEGFMRLCYNFPKPFLPEALPAICNFVTNDKDRKLFRPVNSKYYLEQVVLRFVIGNVRSLRGSPSLGTALLNVLNGLVDEGSSSAYFLRERIVTSL